MGRMTIFNCMPTVYFSIHSNISLVQSDMVRGPQLKRRCSLLTFYSRIEVHLSMLFHRFQFYRLKRMKIFVRIQCLVFCAGDAITPARIFKNMLTVSILDNSTQNNFFPKTSLLIMNISCKSSKAVNLFSFFLQHTL